MEINKRFLTTVVLLLAMCWTGNIVYYKKHALKEPFFLKHLYSLERDSMMDFTLYYLQNEKDTSVIKEIVFPEIQTGTPVLFYEASKEIAKEPYKMKTVTISLGYWAEDSIYGSLKNKIITKAHIKFSNGKELEADIGEIHVFPDYSKTSPITSTVKGNYKMHTSNRAFTVEEDSVVKGAYCTFPELIRDTIEVNISGVRINKNSFPASISKDAAFTLCYSFDIQEDDLQRYDIYYFALAFLTENLKGEQEYKKVFIRNDYLENFDKLNILDLEKKRRER